MGLQPGDGVLVPAMTFAATAEVVRIRGRHPGVGLSIAVSALVARAVGQRNLVMAREKATNGMIIGIGFGVIFAALVWIVLPQIVALIGATGNTAVQTVHFLRIVVPAQPFLMVGMIGGAILRSHGDAKHAMSATLWGAVANAVFDVLLILVLHWDLTGAAISSVISRIVIAGVCLIPIIKYHGGFDRPTVAGLKADLAPVYAIASPAILTQVATPFGQAWSRGWCRDMARRRWRGWRFRGG